MARDYRALIRFIESRHSTPHSWGRRNGNDCAGFALAAVEEQTGTEVAADLDWTDESSALRTIAKFGSLERAFDAYFDRVPPSLAQRGDVAGVVDPEFGIHPTIVEGQTLVSPCSTGNHRVPRSKMTVAWSAESARTRRRKAKLGAVSNG